MHEHAHSSRHRPRSSSRRLAATVAITASYMLAELIGGWLSGSLALLADAGHMLSDSAGLILSLVAGWLARRPASARHTFGYHRAEILAAVFNAATMIVIALTIAIEAVHRFSQPQEVAGPLMLGISVGGLGVNLLGLFLLHDVRHEDLNVRGAWLHVLMDTLGSVAALFAGGLICVWNWTWADPLASVAISIFIFISSCQLLRSAVEVLMEMVPAHLDLGALRAAMLAVPGISEIRELHVWTITSGWVALSAQVDLQAGTDAAAALAEIRTRLHDQFKIEQVTLEPNFLATSGQSRS